MPTFLTPIDLTQNELRNPVAQHLASAPSTPVEGQFYYDSIGKNIVWWDGTTWNIAKGGGSISYGSAGSSAVGDSAANGSNTTVSRSDHVHGREAFAAPTAQTSFGATSATGSATTVPHSDHTHGTPTHDAAAHSAISLSSLAAPTADLAIGAHKLTGVTDPTLAQDAATKAYVDASRAGLSMKDPVRVASTANGTLASAFANGSTVDGISLVTGDRILLKNQTTGADNGIYTVNASGAPTRASDANGSGELVDGTGVWVASGTANGDQRWVLTAIGGTAPWVPGTNASTWTLDFAATSVTAGAGLTGSGQVLAVGAGTGIQVNADTVQVDPAVVVSKFAASIGDGTTTSFTVTHGLGTRDVVVGVYATATPWGEVECDISHSSTTTLTVVFAVAPTTNQYRVVVHA